MISLEVSCLLFKGRFVQYKILHCGLSPLSLLRLVFHTLSGLLLSPVAMKPVLKPNFFLAFQRKQRGFLIERNQIIISNQCTGDVQNILN